MNNELLPHEIVETNANPDATVIWLHGLGADGHDFESIIPEFKLSPSLRLRFIFPHAPMRPVTINGGYPMRAWYDIKSQSIEREVCVEELDQSKKQIIAFIEDQMNKGIVSERIILGGFSQGGAITYYTGLMCPHPLGGLISLSSYNPTLGVVGIDYPAHTQHYPIFIAHGTDDPVVPFSLGEKTRIHLENSGYQVQFHEYPIAHSLCAEEIGHVSAFIQKIL